MNEPPPWSCAPRPPSPAAPLAAPLWAQSPGRIVLGQSAALPARRRSWACSSSAARCCTSTRQRRAASTAGRSSCRAWTTATSPTAARPTPQADRGWRVRAVRLHRHAHQPGRTAAGHAAPRCPSSRPSPARRRCASRSTATPSTCAPRTSTRPAEIVKQITAVGIKRIAVFHQNDSYGKAGLDGVMRALKPLGLEPAGAGHGRAQHGRRGRGGEGHHGRQARRDRADQRLQVLRRLHPRGAQGRLRRHLLQRVLRRHEGPGRRARRRRARRGGEPGDALPVRAGLAARPASTWPPSRPRRATSSSPTTAAWKATSPREPSPRRLQARRRRRHAGGADRRLESLRELNLGGFFVDFGASKHAGSQLRRPDHPDRRRPRPPLTPARESPGRRRIA